MNISSDEVFHKVKDDILKAAQKTKEEARTYLHQRMKELYPEHYNFVCVWAAGRSEHTVPKEAIAVVKFSAM